MLRDAIIKTLEQHKEKDLEIAWIIDNLDNSTVTDELMCEILEKQRYNILSEKRGSAGTGQIREDIIQRWEEDPLCQALSSAKAHITSIRKITPNEKNDTLKTSITNDEGMKFYLAGDRVNQQDVTIEKNKITMGYAVRYRYQKTSLLNPMEIYGGMRDGYTSADYGVFSGGAKARLVFNRDNGTVDLEPKAAKERALCSNYETKNLARAMVGFYQCSIKAQGEPNKPFDLSSIKDPALRRAIKAECANADIATHYTFKNLEKQDNSWSAWASDKFDCSLGKVGRALSIPSLGVVRSNQIENNYAADIDKHAPTPTSGGRTQ